MVSRAKTGGGAGTNQHRVRGTPVGRARATSRRPAVPQDGQAGAMRAPWTGPGQEEAIYRQADAAAKVRDVWPDAETAHYGADGALTGVTDARGTRCAGPDAGGVKGMRVDPACFQRWGERIAAARAGADGRGWELNVPEALAVMHIHQARKLRLGVG